MSYQSNHEKVYEKISSLFKIKFKTQLNGSPIEFRDLMHVRNVITEKEYYVIIFTSNEGEIIKFRDKIEFIVNFVDYLNLKIQELDDEFEALSDFEDHSNSMGIRYNENEVFLRHERIGHGLDKLSKLRDRIKKFNEVKNTVLKS